jgi:DNA-binding winged helix-turn-helix (wHTH) protein
MTNPPPATSYRFGVFEADAVTGELRRKGLRVKLNSQPFQVLCLLLARPGQLLTREEISKELWPEDTFVDYEHGVNSAINRIREALGDTAANPRFVETLARRGYRFVAPVEPIHPLPAISATAQPDLSTPEAKLELGSNDPTTEPTRGSLLATSQDLPKTPYRVVQSLFVLLQLMYVGYYVGALANLPEIEDLFSALPKALPAFPILIVTAVIGIAIRAFLLTATAFHAPGLRVKFLKLFPFLLLLDELWALSPFLLLHHIDFGVALACTPLLVYSPFAQRSLILMGAGTAPQAV